MIKRILMASVSASLLAMLYMPHPAFASAVTVSAFTATSTPAYANTGLATTTRAKVGDTIQYQLTLSGGAPLISPQINLFNTGSTTMTGSGNNWWYATTTTSNAAVWNDGLVSFKVSVGQDTATGLATTTVTAVTSGSNTTFDKTGPTLNSVTWNDNDATTDFSAGDTLVFTFNETMATTTITSANAVTTLGLSGGHDFGPLPNTTWNTAGTQVTIALASGYTVVSGDTVDPTSAVKDAIGNADATPSPVTVADNILPTTPTGLADTSFAAFALVSLASTNATQIRYTEDGSVPSCSSGTVYSSSFQVTTTETVKAVSCDGSSNISSVASAVYTKYSHSSGGSSTSNRRNGSSVAATYVPTTVTTNVSDLMAQVAKLQAMLAALTGGSSSGTSGTFSGNSSFTRDLDVGSEGADVTALQNWLIGKGFAIAAGATGHFGAQTQAALAAWQAANGITPAAGYFGPKTRAAVGK